MLRRSLLVVAVVCACGGRHDDRDRENPAPAPKAAARPAPPAPPPLAEKPSDTPGPTTPMAADAPAGNPPADGKYERVVVEGVTVPMVNIMSGGTVVLVDTDGKKPRTWEEQYKKKSAKLAGQLDVHKTDVNHNGSFDDDPVDREGMWLIDAKGNIVKH